MTEVLKPYRCDFIIFFGMTKFMSCKRNAYAQSNRMIVTMVVVATADVFAIMLKRSVSFTIGYG